MKPASKFFLTALAISLIGFGGQFSLALTSTANAASSSDDKLVAQECKLNEALDKLLSTKDSDLPAADKETAEFDARKEVLNQIVVCSEKEIGDFKARLSNLDLSKNDRKDLLLREKFLGDLDAASFYYEKTKEKLGENLTLDGIKNLAVDILAWRDNFYTPAVSRINDFTLVVGSEQAVKTAKSRFQKISTTLGAIRLSGVSEIKRLLKDSDSLISRAEELNGRAHEMTWEIDQVFDTAVNSSTPASTSSASLKNKEITTDSAIVSGAAANEATSTKNEVLSSVKESLSNLKKAYANYLDISNLVKKILGL